MLSRVESDRAFANVLLHHQLTETHLPPVDAGLATHNLGARAPALLAEALELAPFGKFLYSSDAFGLAELYYLGAALFRSALSAFLRSGLEEDLFTERTAARLARMLGADNAKRAYQLGDQM